MHGRAWIGKQLLPGWELCASLNLGCKWWKYFFIWPASLLYIKVGMLWKFIMFFCLPFLWIHVLEKLNLVLSFRGNSGHLASVTINTIVSWVPLTPNASVNYTASAAAPFYGSLCYFGLVKLLAASGFSSFKIWATTRCWNKINWVHNEHVFFKSKVTCSLVPQLEKLNNW